MNNYCKKCRLRDGCLRKCKEAEIYEQGYNDAVKEFKKLKKTTMENKYKLWVAREKRGGLFLYKTKPILDCDFGIWFSDLDCMGTISKNLFQELKWKDEPIEVELRPAITDLEANAEEYADNVTDNEEIKELIIKAFKSGYNS